MTEIPTQFAPAERAGDEIILRQVKYFDMASPLFHILDSVPDIVVILNKQRQIVFSNHSLVKFTGIQSVNNSYGLRVGEILDCIHSSETPGRCGTTEFCSECGAVRAILNSQAGKADVQECRIIQK